MTASEILQWVTNVTFFAAAVAAFGIWMRRRRSAAARWLLTTFAILVSIIAFGLVVGEDAEIPRVVTATLLALLVFMPWALFRFADEVTGHSRGQVRAVTTLTLLVAGWGFLLPEFPESGDPLGPTFVVYLVALLTAWATGTGLAAWRLFRAGTGQPGVIRNRVRLLGVGSVLLTLTLLVSSLDAGTDPDQETLASLVSGAMAMLSAWAFLAGFAPPGLLRSWWRRREEHELYRSTTLLMQAESPAKVAAIVLRPFQRLVGADALVLEDRDGVVLGSLGALDAFDRAPEWRLLEASGAGELMLRAVMSSTAPLFGQDEREVAERLLSIAGLAVDRARRAADLAVANQQLEAANEELESFVYTASHDLKNPLIAMLGYVDLLEVEHPFEPGSDLAMYVERIEANGWFMSSLIQDLLELSRVGRIEEHQEPVDLERVTAAAAAALQVQYPSMHVTVAAPLPTVRMSPTRAQQLVTNILANAGRHGGEGVEVTITAKLKEAGGARLVFADDGPGIDPGQAERIFRVFERLDPSSSDGNGIGLAVCRKIAKSVDGDMFLEPSDQGARFVVTIGPAHVLPDRAIQVESTPSTDDDAEQSRAVETVSQP